MFVLNLEFHLESSIMVSRKIQWTRPPQKGGYVSLLCIGSLVYVCILVRCVLMSQDLREILVQGISIFL